MKNLLSRSTLGLVMFSLSLISCKKDQVVPPPEVQVATINTSTGWIPKGSETPKPGLHGHTITITITVS